MTVALVFTAGCGSSVGPFAPSGHGGRAGGGAAGSATGTGGHAGGSAGDSGTGGVGGDVGTGGGGGDLGVGGTGGDTIGTGGSDVGGSGGAGGGAAGAGGGGTGGSVAGGSTGNDGGAAGRPTLQPWPSTDAVVWVDSQDQFGSNLSDLVYEAPAVGTGGVLWGLQNDPSLLYCLLWNGTSWAPMTDADWMNGKVLRYPNSGGSPDAEGLTRAELSSTAIYVSAERNNDAGTINRMSILRYDYATIGTWLVATHEWNLTPDLPSSSLNIGVEGLAWIPDSFLVDGGFVDTSTGDAYDPSRYPDHGTGLFFVGHENGSIFAYALNHGTGTFQRVAMIASGQNGVMGLYFDRDLGNLWSYCDNNCANMASVLRISGGRFAPYRLYSRPATLPNSNFEGITFSPESECMDGRRSVFWSDDSAVGGHAIYRGSIPCGPLP